MEPILEIKGISKKYQINHEGGQPYLSIRDSISNMFRSGGKNSQEELWVLKDVQFNIYPGESIGVIGHNGAGKSTLLKILSKIIQPTEGSIISRGRIASLLEVGTGFHPELTGRENIYLNGSILGMRRTEISEKFDAIVDFSGVEKFLDTPLKRYSSGMQLRLAFAVAAFLEPEILVIDEVLAVGDAEFQKKCIGKMNDVSKSGRTILFVSHNMGIVKSLCSKCAVLKAGKVEYFGPTNEAIKIYLAKDKSDAQRLNFKNRKGGQTIELKEILLFEKDHNEPVAFFHSGMDVKIRIVFRSTQKIINKKPRLDVGINDELGTRLAWLSTELFDVAYPDQLNEYFQFDLEIKKLPLNQGLYSFTTCLWLNNEIMDWCPEVLEFNIEKGNYFNNGKQVIEDQIKFLIDHKWQVL